MASERIWKHIHQPVETAENHGELVLIQPIPRCQAGNRILPKQYLFEVQAAGALCHAVKQLLAALGRELAHNGIVPVQIADRNKVIEHEELMQKSEFA